MGHTYSNVFVHAVFSTKGRLPTIRESFKERLYQYLSGVARNEVGQATRIGGTDNHIHLLLWLKPAVSIAEAIRKMKSISSGWVHETFPGNRDFGWQSGYSVFGVSASAAPAIAHYIERQAEHHKTVTFEEEFIALLKENGVEYDPRYIWD